MEFSISMPIILFPAISLILLAYTEKFVQLGRLLRVLKQEYDNGNASNIELQIANLKKRIYYIRNMQAFGTTSFFFCLLTILLLFMDQQLISEILFSVSMIFLMISLWLAFCEVRLSARALHHALK